MTSRAGFMWTLVCALGITTLAAGRASAHCDGLDGPVVKAALKALDSGNVKLVLIWVQRQDEQEIVDAFDKTLAVRKLSPDARQLADTWFLETLVRIHRAGEGAPFTGLKPAGRDLGPAIPAADKALETGIIDPVSNLLTVAVQTGVKTRFSQTVARQSFKHDDVEAGREYVRAYVTFVHYVEGLHKAAVQPTHSHGETSMQAGGHAAEPAPAQAHADRLETKGNHGTGLSIPEALELEHEELHAELVKATKAGGKIGAAATVVAGLLHPHFVKEEQYALPPLGLLPRVARGEESAEMRAALAMTDQLKAELPQMLAEHRSIVAALEELRAAAFSEGDHDVAQFAEKLTRHARTEEDVLYPAAIVLGEYLRTKLTP